MRPEPRPIAVEEALTFGGQIAEALEAAHEQLIIHRDPDGADRARDEARG